MLQKNIFFRNEKYNILIQKVCYLYFFSSESFEPFQRQEVTKHYTYQLTIFYSFIALLQFICTNDCFLGNHLMV